MSLSPHNSWLEAADEDAGRESQKGGVMNVPLLREIQARILAEPEHFRMDTWSCGTAHCIGGWAVLLSGLKLRAPSRAGKIIYVEDGRRVSDAAREIIGGFTWPLLYVSNWPLRFMDDYLHAERSLDFAQKARIAAARIDYFIETNGYDDRFYEAIPYGQTLGASR